MKVARVHGDPEKPSRAVWLAQFPAQDPQAPVHVAQFFDHAFDGKLFNIRLAGHGEVHDHAAGFLETIGLAHGLGNDQDVAEQDRGVETESAHRLKRDLGGQFRILDKLNKGVGSP